MRTKGMMSSLIGGNLVLLFGSGYYGTRRCPPGGKSDQPNAVSAAWSLFTLHYFSRPARCCESLGPRALHDVNSRCFDDRSISLHLASREGHVEVARLIVEHGADSAAQDK